MVGLGLWSITTRLQGQSPSRRVVTMHKSQTNMHVFNLICPCCYVLVNTQGIRSLHYKQGMSLVNLQGGLATL